MTALEVCAALRADAKCYALIRMARSTFCQTLKQIETGKAKPVTIKEFFGKFNYCTNDTDIYELNNWSKA